MESKDLNERSRHISSVIASSLNPLVESLDTVAEVRGLGAMQAIEFVESGSMRPNKPLVGRIVAKAMQAGLIMLTCGINGNVIRLLPPLVMTDDELNEALDVLKAIIIEESAR
jgi:4-aminobutyrate aminotransferase/(S)-3-amino-2-methylpropionate transaminase